MRDLKTIPPDNETLTAMVDTLLAAMAAQGAVMDALMATLAEHAPETLPKLSQHLQEAQPKFADQVLSVEPAVQKAYQEHLAQVRRRLQELSPKH